MKVFVTGATGAIGRFAIPALVAAGHDAVANLATAIPTITTRSQRVSNAKIKAASGWRPAYPSAREGWKATVGNA